MIRTTAPALLVVVCFGGSAFAGDGDINFSRDILPLLSNNCFKCHGPDKAHLEAGLRLDKRDSAILKLESGHAAVVPGDSNQSELFRRITSADPEERMPPVDSGKTLTTEQIALIRKWIDGGAEWSGHWAFQPPQKPDIPTTNQERQAHNSIDSFIQARLAAANLSQEQRASKETLIRRATLDLTGLPPTVSDIDAFLADGSDQAFERVVDRLLASKTYGEHMARFWLDAARYGDTHGLHLDNERSIWPYRDWVIASFNRNQPFDQFTIEQLAGDLLPEPTVPQRVATGFNRCNVTTSEGGSIDDEYYMRYAVDRVETTATVWLGLTAGCAACHDHKFDPLTQKEFYQLFSYYFSLTERAMDGNALLPPPSVKIPSETQSAQKTQYTQDLTAVDARIAALLADFKYTDPTPTEPLGELSEEQLIWIDDELPAGASPQGNGTPPWQFVEAPDHPVHSGRKSTVRTGAGEAITQHFFTGATDKLKLGENAKLIAWVYLDPQNPPQTIQLQFNNGTWEHRASWGADKAFGAGRKNASNQLIGALPETGKWIRLEVDATLVGLSPGSELNGWAFTQVGGTVHWDSAGVTSQSLSNEQKRSLFAWEQFRAKVKQPALPAEIQKLLDVEKPKRTPEQTEQLTGYFIQNVHPDSRAMLAEPLQQQATLRKQLADLENAIPATLVMEDRLEPRQAHVLERGQYTERREAVSSAVPEWLAPAIPNAPANRLGLAQWLVQPRHPLTARVTVNRFWQQLFGTGLVKTSEDFGVQGQHPSHPALLDWLAIDFVESGWDVKRCLKQIVMTATYQQSSRVTREKLEADPENQMLARGPRFRLDAEVIRDQALSLSGLLIDTIGGKSVKPYQPAGLWKPVGFGGSNTSVFVQDTGDKLFRRSMYTFWKRTVPPPSMATFDAPDRETCQVRRARTNTPLQALVLMNDVQYVEAARKFAERVINEGGSRVDERVTFAFRSAVARRPNAREMQSLTTLFTEYLSEFKSSPDLATKLLSNGESPRDEKLEATELAAWTMVTHLLLNLSESVTKG
ncbi:MAG: PSD1 and planctomycete cytochrome C domain-containing protein [Planctomycetota bacterium]|nr:PSD1 and planctomycete cytochrome C domain-containing protein [Planctomycetota bacterium]